MGLIHHLLYTHENIDNISVHEFAKQVIHSTLKHYDFNGVSIVENFDDIGSIKAGALIPYGIILNEIVSNAIMYAFTHHSNPSLNINMYKYSDEVVLHIKDNGWGIQSPNTEGLGIELIKMLTEQINGKVEFYNDNGLNVKVIVPMNELTERVTK
jgi:two-component sensor histidine kinase